MAGNPIDISYGDAIAITTSDSVTYSPPLRGLYVGGAGALTVTTAQGNKVSFANVTAGSNILLNVTQVWATGTAATDIVGYRS